MNKIYTNSRCDIYLTNVDLICFNLFHFKDSQRLRQNSVVRLAFIAHLIFSSEWYIARTNFIIIRIYTIRHNQARHRVISLEQTNNFGLKF